MDDALARWLELREPHDWAARDASLVDEIRRALPVVPTMRIVDLGTGAGSNFRYLAPRLGAAQAWRLVDKSPDVLERIRERTRAWAAQHDLVIADTSDDFRLDGPTFTCTVRLERHDLDLPIDPQLFAGSHLVTASALLDLASTAWIAEVATACVRTGAAALFALNYDGRSRFDPPDQDDDLAQDLLNAHQLRDKGLGGPAAGPGAHAVARQAFADLGFAVCEAETNWDVAGSAAAFQRELIAGLAGAATEQDPLVAERIAAWQSRRLALLDAGRSRVIVGHHDLAAWPQR